MPNTLAHIGINGFMTNSLYRKVNLAWIFLGCIIPDIPWILKKIVQFLYPTLIGFDLHTYLIIQASLLFCIIISAAFASISINFYRTFITLILGSFLHLLLDAFQIKWANGVHFFAPFSWELFYSGLFWPESVWTYLITASGIFYLLFNYKNLTDSFPKLQLKVKNLLLMSSLLIIYFLSPTLFMDEVEKNDCHFIGTLKNYNSRTGKYIEMDRKKVIFNEDTNSYWIQSFDNNLIELNGIQKLTSTKISIQGTFINKNLIDVTEYHENWEEFRDGASYAGLSIILISWVISGFKSKRRKHTA